MGSAATTTTYIRSSKFQELKIVSAEGGLGVLAPPMRRLASHAFVVTMIVCAIQFAI